MSLRLSQTALAAAVLAVAGCQCALAQTPAPAIITIDTEDSVQYFEDSDPSKFVTNPNVTTAAAPTSFGAQVGIQDIVAVNGQPAKGTVLVSLRVVEIRPSPSPGQGIAYTQRSGVINQTFEILARTGERSGQS